MHCSHYHLAFADKKFCSSDNFCHVLTWNNKPIDRGSEYLPNVNPIYVTIYFLSAHSYIDVQIIVHQFHLTCGASVE